jgi:uncharacterized membrane protein YdjX (TVP38/TMEM64 family)
MRKPAEIAMNVRRYARVFVRFGLIGMAIFALRIAFVDGYVSEVDIHSVVNRAGVLAVPGFILVCALGELILAPRLLFIAWTSIAFGTTIGTVYSLLGITAGVCAAFLLGRYGVPDFARKRKKGKLKRIDEWMQWNGLAFTFSARLMFPANSAFNYVASLTSVNFKDFLLGSFIGLIPSVTLASYFFHVLTHAETLMAVLTHPAFISFWLLRGAGVALFTTLTKKYGKRKSPETPLSKPQPVTSFPAEELNAK